MIITVLQPTFAHKIKNSPPPTFLPYFVQIIGQLVERDFAEGLLPALALRARRPRLISGYKLDDNKQNRARVSEISHLLQRKVYGKSIDSFQKLGFLVGKCILLSFSLINCR